MTKFNDLTGRVFERLTVVSREPSRGYMTMWQCVCQCGRIKVVSTANLGTGNSRSCGCIRTERLVADNKARQTTHGMSRTPLYRIWGGIITRCRNPRGRQWPDYGGRGIKICDEWATSFEAFRDYMPPRPSPRHQIDRIDNDGNYEPGNVRWATVKEQALNRRTSTAITIDGQTKTLSQWADDAGIDRATFVYRLKRGWHGDRLFAKP